MVDRRDRISVTGLRVISVGAGLCPGPILRIPRGDQEIAPYRTAVGAGLCPSPILRIPRGDQEIAPYRTAVGAGLCPSPILRIPRGDQEIAPYYIRSPQAIMAGLTGSLGSRGRLPGSSATSGARRAISYT